MGTTGFTGLGLILKNEIATLWASGGLSNKKPQDAMIIIRQMFWKHQERELRIAKTMMDCTGNNTAVMEAICGSVVAVPVTKQFCLFQFSPQGSPDMCTDDLPFVAMGGGQLIGDVFLAFLRRVFWSKSTPNVADGILATVWTIRHAISTSPGGVADPMQIAVLQYSNGKPNARELDLGELEEHFQNVAGLESEIGKIPLSKPALKIPDVASSDKQQVQREGQ
jgi:hypothetical protein